MSMQDAIKDKYGAVAESDLSSDHAGVKAVAEAFGYTAEELITIPAEANMGLSCGNPTASANLRAGEVVVDLGSGGGLDVFLASQKVGPTGRAIGIDMTPSMVERANKAAAKGVDGKPFSNVEFRLGTIDKIPVTDGSVDVVISNCVINLAPDKPAVFREIARILKAGGRLAVSDIALKKPLPSEIAQDVMAFIGCIAGAIRIEEYKAQLKAAGFDHVQVIDSGADLNAYAQVENQSACCSPPMEATKGTACCTPLKVVDTACCELSPEPKDGSTKEPCCEPAPKDSLHNRLADLVKRYNVNEYAASVKVFAVKKF